MISPRTTIDTEATKFTKSVWYMSVDGVRELAKLAARALANVRRDAGNASETLMAEAVLREFDAAKLRPEQVIARFVPLGSLPAT